MRQVSAGLPLIGASACIAACIGYYSIRFTGLQVKLAPRVGVPVLAVTMLWLGLQVAGAYVTLGGVAPGYWAHLGGFVAGLLLSLAFKAPKQAERQMGHHVMDQMASRSAAAKLAATDLHLTDHPDDVRALFKKIDAHAMMGDSEHEAEALLKLLERMPPRDQPPVLNRLLGINQIHQITSLKRLRFAEELKDEPALSKSLLLSVVQEPKDSQRPDALLALLPLCDDAEAKLWADELKESYPMHPATGLATARGLL